MAVKYEPKNLTHLYHLSRLDEKILNLDLKAKYMKL